VQGITPPNFNISTAFDTVSDKNRKGNYYENDVPLLDKFIKGLGLSGVENLEGLKNYFNISKTDGDISSIFHFFDFIKNGAFFMAWADHYAEQAKKMAQSLGFAA